MFKVARTFCALAACLFLAQATLLAVDKDEKKTVADTSAMKKGDTDAKKPVKGESLKNANAELTRELRDFAKNPAETKLRSSSDYFTSLPEDVTIDQLFTALESRQSSEPVFDAYIRWQYMSALPTIDLEPKQVQKLFNAYRSAPQPYVRYGLKPQERQQFEAMLQGATENDEEAAEAKLGELRKEIDTANGIINRFRSALIARFPRSHDLIALTLNEAQLRVDKGINVTNLVKSLTDNIHLWIVMDSPSVQEMQSVVEMLNKAKAYKGPALIREIKWDDKTRTLKVSSYGETIGHGESFTETLKELKEAIENPGANELKFKDDDSKPKSRYRK